MNKPTQVVAKHSARIVELLDDMRADLKTATIEIKIRIAEPRKPAR